MMSRLYITCLLYLLTTILPAQSALIEENMDYISIHTVGQTINIVKQNKDGVTKHQITNTQNVLLELEKFMSDLNTRSDSIDLYVLYDLLLKPIAPLQQHLIFECGPPFDQLPFAALTYKPTLGHENYKKHPYLVKQHTITYQQNLESWRDLTNRAVSGKGISIITEEEDAPYSFLQESRDIRDNFGGEIVSPTTYDNSGKRILHIAHPYQFKSQQFWVEDEVLKFNGELMTLSYFDATVSDQILLDNTMPSKSLVYSMWPDTSTSRKQIMTTFYSQLFDGARKNDALQQAQIRYLKKTTDPNRAHPYYWSGWTLSGDIKSVNNIVNAKVYLIIVALILLSYVLVKKAKIKLY